MKKSVFSYMVNGEKIKFDTIRELRNARRKLQENGMDCNLQSIRREEVEIKASASIEFDTYVYEDMFGDKDRTLTAYVTVKAGKNSRYVFEKIADIMEYRLEWEFERCPDETDEYYLDGITFKYQHGFMTDLKQDIKDSFSHAKKVLKIR